MFNLLANYNTEFKDILLKVCEAHLCQNVKYAQDINK